MYCTILTKEFLFVHLIQDQDQIQLLENFISSHHIIKRDKWLKLNIIQQYHLRFWCITKSEKGAKQRQSSTGYCLHWLLPFRPTSHSGLLKRSFGTLLQKAKRFTRSTESFPEFFRIYSFTIFYGPSFDRRFSFYEICEIITCK